MNGQKEEQREGREGGREGGREVGREGIIRQPTTAKISALSYNPQPGLCDFYITNEKV